MSSASTLFLENPPLIATVARVQFDPVLKMAGFVPDFQERIRKMGFPKYREHRSKEIRIVAGVQDAREKLTWLFANHTTSCAFALEVNSLSLVSAAYTTFAEFAATLAEGIAVLADLVSPTAVTMLGFRAVNVIKTSEKDAPQGPLNLLNEGIRGMCPTSLPIKHFHHDYRFWGDTGIGQIVIQGKLAHGKNCLPPDFRQNIVALKESFQNYEYVYVLDLDHTTRQKNLSLKFGDSEVLTYLDELHEIVNGAFLGCVTNASLQQWGTRS